MRAAHHFQLSDQAIRDLAQDKPHDVLVKDMRSTLGWDGPGLSDSRAFELYKVPGEGYEYSFNLGMVSAGSVLIATQCETLSTNAGLQQLSESFCDRVANPAEGSICQDLEDVVDLDHCDDTPRAQASHFMRATTQTTDNAHRMALVWITSNVESAAAEMTSRLGARREAKNRSIRLTSGLPSKHLGRALHALQDSFSGGHVLREQGERFRTGPILHVYAYRNQDHAEHDRHDCATVDTGYVIDDFSSFGRVVIEASMELIWVTIKMANEAIHEAKNCSEFKSFVQRWLSLSPSWQDHKDDPTLP